MRALNALNPATSERVGGHRQQRSDHSFPCGLADWDGNPGCRADRRFLRQAQLESFPCLERPT